MLPRILWLVNQCLSEQIDDWTNAGRTGSRWIRLAVQGNSRNRLILDLGRWLAFPNHETDESFEADDTMAHVLLLSILRSREAWVHKWSLAVGKAKDNEKSEWGPHKETSSCWRPSKALLLWLHESPHLNVLNSTSFYRSIGPRKTKERFQDYTTEKSELQLTPRHLQNLCIFLSDSSRLLSYLGSAPFSFWDMCDRQIIT